MKTLLVDISHYQGTNGMSYARYRQCLDQGVRAIVLRATIGGAQDRAFVSNIKRAAGKAAGGMFVMAYHFLQPGDIEAQADLFAATVPDRMACWLDVEQSGLTRRHVVRFARRFRQKRPHTFLGVYSSSSKWRSLTENLDGAELFDACWNALWTEKGTDERSDLPDVAPKPRWGGFREALLWQYGAFHLKDTALDGDVFHGTLAELKASVGVAQPIPMDERPARRRAYNDQLAAFRRTIIATADITGQGAAWQDGTEDARADLLDALNELVLADPA